MRSEYGNLAIRLPHVIGGTLHLGSELLPIMFWEGEGEHSDDYQHEVNREERHSLRSSGGVIGLALAMLVDAAMFVIAIFIHSLFDGESPCHVIMVSMPFHKLLMCQFLAHGYSDLFGGLLNTCSGRADVLDTLSPHRGQDLLPSCGRRCQ